MNSEKEDVVNHPKHYETDVGFECIECMKMFMSDEYFKGFLLGNAFKYIWRHKLKGNPDQDISKAKWYLDYYEKCFIPLDITTDESYNRYVLLRDKVSSYGRTTKA